MHRHLHFIIFSALTKTIALAMAFLNSEIKEENL